MSDYGARNETNWRRPAQGYRPEFLDPVSEPALYDGVLTRRALAFLIDVVILAIPVAVVSVVLFLFAIVTLGLGWPLLWLISPASAIWAIVYYGASLGGPHAATPGMRLLGIRMMTLNGGEPYFLLGAGHAILYWLSITLLSPFVVLVAPFNRRRRLLHDFVLGTVFVNDRPMR